MPSREHDSARGHGPHSLTGLDAASLSPLKDDLLQASVAAVLYDRADPIEKLMATVAARLRADAIHVGGLVQHNLRLAGRTHCCFEFEDLISGARYPLTQNLGSASQSCALDTTALAEASCALRQAVIDRVQIVIVNKFGEQEATGHGMRNEMMQIVTAGIPLLTSVSRRHLPQWLDFVGDYAQLLAPSLAPVLSWAQQHVRYISLGPRVTPTAISARAGFGGRLPE